jgi:hypothetical protein
LPVERESAFAEKQLSRYGSLTSTEASHYDGIGLISLDEVFFPTSTRVPLHNSCKERDKDSPVMMKEAIHASHDVSTRMEDGRRSSLGFFPINDPCDTELLGLDHFSPSLSTYEVWTENALCEWSPVSVGTGAADETNENYYSLDEWLTPVMYDAESIHQDHTACGHSLGDFLSVVEELSAMPLRRTREGWDMIHNNIEPMSMQETQECLAISLACPCVDPSIVTRTQEKMNIPLPKASFTNAKESEHSRSFIQIEDLIRESNAIREHLELFAVLRKNEQTEMAQQFATLARLMAFKQCKKSKQFDGTASQNKSFV